METTLRGPALNECPQCGEKKKSYAQHWVRSATCSYPRITASQHALIQGILLGDASLGNPSGNAKLRLSTTHREFGEWVYDQLGWLAGKLTTHTRESGEDVYRVVAMAHPDCNRYRGWYHESEKRPPAGFAFTPESARAFHACDGTLVFGPGERPYVGFRASDSVYRERLVDALTRWRIPTTSSTDGRVRIPTESVPDWLTAIGPPVPGVEYKWETDREAYRKLR